MGTPIVCLPDGDFYAPFTDLSPRSNLQANAEFIVRACNAHDDLLEALKNLYAISEPLHHEDDLVWFECKKQVKAAISKAEGGA